jgi:hypothetical protein
MFRKEAHVSVSIGIIDADISNAPMASRDNRVSKNTTCNTINKFTKNYLFNVQETDRKDTTKVELPP